LLIIVGNSELFRQQPTYDNVFQSIENDNVWLDDQYEYVFYAQKVKSFDKPDEMFSQIVSFVQNYIEKQFELRIITVADKTFIKKQRILFKYPLFFA
jgi:hypothetical protein